MKKKIIFESIFILLLVTIGAYLILAILAETQSDTIDPVNSTNLSSKVTFGTETIFAHNFTCNTTIGDGAAGPGGGLVTGNLSLVATWTSSNGSLSVNKTNKSDVYAGNVTGFMVNATADGTYIWHCRTNYNANVTVLRSPNVSVTIDLTAPTVSNVANGSANGTGPGGTWVSNNTEVNAGNESRIQTKWAIVASASDTGSLIRNCSLYSDFSGTYGNNGTNNSAVVYQNNGSLLTFPEQGASYRNLTANATGYKYSVACTDHANNTIRSGNATLFVDGIPPNGSINTPVSVTTNYSSWSDESISFNAITYDVGNSTLSNCSLYSDFNGTWNRNLTANVSGLDNVSFDFTSLTLNTNTTGYRYNILCKDRANNRRNLSVGERLITIDASAPGATITSSAGTTLGVGQATTLECKGTDDVETASMKVTVNDGTTVCSSVASCSGTYIMATSNAKVVTCQVDDQVGHVITKTLDLSYAGGDGGAGGGAGAGGAGGGAESTTITTEPTTITSTSGAGESIPLTIQGESYNLGIESVGVATTSVSLAGQTLDLVVGETTAVDVNGDGTNDVEVTLDGISDNKPQFTIREIALAAPGEEIGVLEEIIKKPSATKIALIALAIVLAIVVIIYIYERRKK